MDSKAICANVQNNDSLNQLNLEKLAFLIKKIE